MNAVSATTRPSTHAGPSGRLRLASRVALGALATGSLLGALAAPPAASAGPRPSVGAISTNAGTNTATLSAWSAQTGAVWADLAFRSTASHAVVQISKQAPTMVNGQLSLGAAQPIVLQGKTVPGDIGDLATATTYGFTLSPDGLTPDTTYHVLVSLPGKAGQDANIVAKSFKTKRRVVTATVEWVHVSDDADPGLARGAGEIRFGVRVAPDGSKIAPKPFSSWTGWMSLATGADKVFAGSTLTTQADTRNGHAYVQIQGQEDDRPAVGFCPLGTPVTPIQGSTKCGDQAFAEGFVNLPTVRAQGELDTVVLAKVIGTPALQFQAQVRIRTASL